MKPFFSIFFWLLLVLVTIYFATSVFTIKKVICQVDQQVCPDYTQAELEKNLGKSLLFHRYDQVIAHLQKLQPSLQFQTLGKEINGQVSFTFHQTQPLYGIKSDGREILLVDEYGVVTGTTVQTNLPTLTISDIEAQKMTIGSRLSLDQARDIQILIQSIQQKEIPAQMITILPDNQVEILLPANKKAVLLLRQAETQLRKLQYLLQHQDQLQIKENFSLIDLRFKYPILKT